MDTRTALLAAAAALLVASAVGAVAAPGAISDPRATDEPPGRIDVAGATVAPGDVRGETAELRLGTDLRHRGGTVKNVTVRHRAIGAESGLLVDETTVEVGDVDFEGERTVNGTVTVEREGGYRIETVVFADGQRRQEQTTRVAGVAALTPDYADTQVGFTDGSVWPTVAVSVVEADNETATLSASVSVTNRGDEASEDVDLRLYLRQAESNVIAAEATETVGTVRPGRTDAVTATVEVPAGYNYYVDAALFDDDVLVDETQGVANLNPRETITANETVRDVAFSVEDFERDDAGGEGGDGSDRAPTDGASDGSTPGFGPLVALVALVVAALTARRRR
ncbi:PGF-CTERM sorting domain-containing protein [Halorubrum terrestre]|uniref:PGF-CTERM sorting domain-containing protein n=1 Tax=Halorubrum distributum TaxID=29283 RepID=A0A6B1IBL6_9EURY|nr:PGF-CTERM sorting domain-containing protein [Halorubrum terrestre]MYL15556.1 PGF-CTERM sorting domain-containing protein [Halorubrum terrestre]